MMRITDRRPSGLATLASRMTARLPLRALLLALYTTAAVALGAYLHKYGTAREILDAARVAVDSPVRRIVALATTRPDHLLIDIKHLDFQRLAYQRECAVLEGKLFADDEDYVPAKIRFQGQTTDVEMRLKGDSVEHLRGEKWSYRVVAKGDDALLGMKRFSLHHPAARNDIHEWFYHRVMKREDLIGLRYQFVNVTINGKDLGVYALEEHFEKRLVESNRRREGPLVRFDEAAMWEAIVLRNSFVDRAAEQHASGDYLASQVDGFQTTRWMETPEQREVYLKAVDLLEAFRRGEASTSEVFDVPRLARYFALVDVLGAEHGARWHNMRFYYNPVTARLEPVAFDGLAGTPITGLVATRDGPPGGGGDPRSDVPLEDYYGRIFADRAFLSAYLAALEKYSRPEWLAEVLAEYRDDIDAQLALLHREFPSVELHEDVFAENQRLIRTWIHPRRALRVYSRRLPSGATELQLGNLQPLPLEVTTLRVGEERVLLNEPVLLPGRHPDQPLRFVTREVSLPELPPPSEAAPATTPPIVTAAYKVWGTQRVDEVPIADRSQQEEEPVLSDVVRQAANVDQFDFLRIDEASQTIHVQPGAWTIDTTLIVPAGYRLRAGPGTRLDLARGAMLVTRSPLVFRGEPEQPMVVTSSDGQGRGILVLQAPETSILEYVEMQHLTCPVEPGWMLTGAITFYEADAEIRHSRFADMGCEDAVNFIRCRFSIEESVFAGNDSDALDADFCDGKLHRVRFIDSGNDGIDVSGSRLTASASGRSIYTVNLPTTAFGSHRPTLRSTTTPTRSTSPRRPTEPGSTWKEAKFATASLRRPN